MENKKRPSFRLPEKARKAGILLGWFFLWQMVAWIIHNPLYFAGPLESAAELVRMVPRQSFLAAVMGSCARIWLGFALAAVLAYVLAFASWRFSLSEEVLAPFVSFIRSVPVAALAVVFLIWSGAEHLVLYISFMVVFPNIYGNLLTGLKKTDTGMLQMAEVYHMPFRKRLRCILRPAYLPYSRAALTHSVGMCFKAGVAAEIIGLPDASVGTALYMDKIYLNTAGIFAWVAVIVGISWLTEKGILRLVGAVRIPKMGKAAGPAYREEGREIDRKGLVKKYEDRTVVDVQTLRLTAGERMCLYGSSGSGKTTLLHLLAGITEPEEKNGRRNRVALCFQENRLWEEADAVVNLWMAGCCGDYEEELAELLPRELLHRPVKELSGGEKRRVALARAVLFPAEWLLLDEPFTGLDEENRRKAAAWILERQMGRPMIVATHEEADAELLKAEKWILEAGKLKK